MRWANQDTYWVLDDLGGNFGRVWRVTAEADANQETLIRGLFDDQYSPPTRIVAFTTMRAGTRHNLGRRRRNTAMVCSVR